ncbi:MAG: hypothetical protein JST76_14805 [Bacteroidetes bacterium]|nr:hypothetical protein [Bacteroidota bacterium]
MKTFIREHKVALAGFACYLLLSVCILACTDGTADEGDSIMHYLYARYAIKYPLFFFHSWAKPVYTLVFFAAAQIGFAAVRLQNVLISCMTLWLVYLTGRRLGYRWAPFIFIIGIFCRLVFIESFSGLTEPLADLMVTTCVYLIVTGRYGWSAVLISFLPFIRSEGIFIGAVMAGYLVWLRQWRLLPLMLTGHLLYGLAGAPYQHGDLLWPLHTIPYATADGHYGSGPWLYYMQEMPSITGVPDAALLYVGVLGVVVAALISLLQRRSSLIRREPLLLAAIFIIFLSMHTVFWALGIFGSFGMTRVFVAIGGVMMLLMVIGMEYLDQLLSRLRYHSYIVGMVYIVAAVFFVSHHSIYAYYPYDFIIHTDQECDSDAITYVRQHIPDQRSYHYYFDASYFSELTDIDIFYNAMFDNNEPGTRYAPGSIILWDDFYSAFEHHVPLDSLRHHPELREVRTFEHTAPWGDVRKVVLFVRDK